MDKGLEHTEIKFEWGTNVEQAVNKLIEHRDKGELVFGDFNGNKLYSDTVTMDSAHLEIVGKTKAELEQSHLEWRKRVEELEKEHEAAIPELEAYWNEKGKEILDEDKLDEWAKTIPGRLRDMYQGSELGHTLDIVKILNQGGNLTEAKRKIDSQDHSGLSHSVVCYLVNKFAVRGSEFVEYVSR